VNRKRSPSRSACPGDPGRRARGFTLVELMIVVAVLGVLVSIFMPVVERTRESDRRARCYENLVRLSAALRDYAAANGHYYPATRGSPRVAGYTCFTGPDDPSPFAASSAVQPNDVTASLWLLVRLELAAPRDFVCPSTDDAPDPLDDGAGQPVSAAQRGNFRSPEHLSYSYACPFSTAPGYRLNDTRPAEFALIADRNPGASAAVPACDAGPLEMSVANSANHRRSGQNVLYADGHVEFCATPYCGRAGDNIYTAFRRTTGSQPTTGPTSLATALGGRPADARGVTGRDVAPAWEADSYLVPTAADGGAPPPPPPVGTGRTPAGRR
jgi:prepilin-type N-terminal cleavage/methylation domain-containing protein/prepilin-type processing-associated H-X9-DG protein